MSGSRNNSIDILRLAAAFAVVCLHLFSGSGVWGAEEIVAVARFAVPLFFLISGYFAEGFSFRKKLWQTGKVFALAVLSNLLYVVLNLPQPITWLLIRMRMSLLFGPSEWPDILLYNISPASEHLWFLGALLNCLLLDLLFSGAVARLRGRRAITVGLACVLLAGGLIVYHICGSNPNTGFQLYQYRNFLFLGLPFFLFGKLAWQMGLPRWRLPIPVYLALIPLFCVASIVEYRLYGVWELYISSALLAVALLYMALDHPLSSPKSLGGLPAWLGRNTSLAIYIFHIYILDQVRGLYFAQLPWQYELSVYHLIPLAVFLVSMLVGAALALGKAAIKRLAAAVFNIGKREREI